MNFLSLPFLSLFAALFAGYWLLRPPLARRLLLLAASYAFYSWLDWRLGAFMLTYSALNYAVAGWLAAGRPGRRAVYWLGILLDVAFLAGFKYLAPGQAGWFVPIGISFITLQALSYLTDVYRGTLAHERDVVSFGLYFALFTKVTAGPIERGKALLPQLAAPAAWNWTRFNEGLYLVILGYVFKVVIADSISLVVAKVFILQKPTLWLLATGSLAFTLQIYADFAAYTNLARGFGKLLGLEHVENFNSPYLSISPSDFWNRWHISFSTWLRDYIFFPVRRWSLQAHLPNLLAVVLPPLVTMLASGAWHGVGWTFIVWGLYYGLLLAAYQLLGIDERLRAAPAWQRLLAWAVNFGLIVFGWTIFRAPSLGWLANALVHPIYGRAQDSLVTGAVILALSGFYAIPMLLNHWAKRLAPRYPLGAAVYYAALFILLLVFLQFGGQSSQEFIYFNF